MKTLSEWQKALAEAARQKFPDNEKRTQLDWVRSNEEQLADVKAAIQVENGELKSDDHAHQDPDHRIAALIADVLLLADARNTDIEKEMESVLKWFKTPSEE